MNLKNWHLEQLIRIKFVWDEFVNKITMFIKGYPKFRYISKNLKNNVYNVAYIYLIFLV